MIVTARIDDGDHNAYDDDILAATVAANATYDGIGYGVGTREYFVFGPPIAMARVLRDLRARGVAVIHHTSIRDLAHAASHPATP